MDSSSGMKRPFGWSGKRWLAIGLGVVVVVALVILIASNAGSGSGGIY